MTDRPVRPPAGRVAAENSNPAKPPIDLTVMVTCYNEEKLITKALDTVRQLLEGGGLSYEVLIYDDHSRDRSVDVVRRYLSEHNIEDLFFLIVNETNLGIGVNYFRAADKARGEYLLIVHGDSAVPLEGFRKVLELIGKANIISPFYSTRLFNTKYNWDHRPFLRRFLSLLFVRLVCLLSGHELRYYNGLALHRTALVRANRCEAYGLGYQAELMCRLLNDPEITYLEVRQHNYDNATGTTSAFRLRSILSVAGSLWRIFAGRFQRRHRR